MIFLLLLLFAASPAGVAAAEPRAQGGLAAYEQGDFSLALEQFQGRVALEPREAIHYYNLGTTLFRLKQLAQAGEAFQRALSLDPTLSAARHNLQVVREEQARQEQGEKQQKQQEKGEQGEKGQEQQQEQEDARASSSSLSIRAMSTSWIVSGMT
ncbi:MAG: tetratricopeptide repeat protein, partial [Thermodesulfobacteriota bacterium]